MKKALITGITGQDGSYLAKLLIKKGYKVYGTARRSSVDTNSRLKELNILDQVEIVPVELLEFTNIFQIIKTIMPDEIYNLGAQSFVGASFEQPLYTSEVTAMGCLRILECIKQINTKIKFYQASSSEMFGLIQEPLQTEHTKFYPRSPYAVAKTFAHYNTINYRESYNIFACCGILFNHESPLRGIEFVTRKISIGLSRIANGEDFVLELGNMDAKRDWGFAPDFVEAMYLMMQQDKPDDYVVATGKTHSIKEFITIATNTLNIPIRFEGEGLDMKIIRTSDKKIIIKSNPKFYRPTEVDILIGDSQKAKEHFGWTSKTSFNELVELMVQSDFKKIKNMASII